MTTKYLDGAGLKYFHDNYVLTQSQITTMINNALSQYQQDIVTVVSALPSTGQKEGILYMVPDATDATKFDTFVWEITDDTTTPPTYGWVQQGEGNATIDLSNYYTKTETDTLLQGKASATHTHGNITNDGKLGTASRAVVTDANGWTYLKGYAPKKTESMILIEQYQSEIVELKKYLSDTDYKAIKFAEGELSEEAYREVKSQRHDARVRINELESLIEQLEKGNNTK